MAAGETQNDSKEALGIASSTVGDRESTEPLVKENRIIEYCAVAIACVTLILYSMWTTKRVDIPLPMLLAPFVSVVLFCIGIFRSVDKTKQLFSITPEVSFYEDYDQSLITLYRKINFLTIWCFVLALEIGFIAAAVNTNGTNGILESLFGRIRYGFDCNSYIELAKNWYQNVDSDLKLYIVFFPVYPAIMRGVHLFVENYTLCGFIISGFFAICAGVVLFELALLEHGLGFAKRVVAFNFLLPVSFFFVVPETESTFLFCTVLFFYLLKREKWLLLFFVGIVAALTRSAGVLLFVPFMATFLPRVLVKRDGATGFLWNKNLNGLQTIKIFVCGLGPLIGIGLYLLLNYQVYGNFFQFAVFQREHWSLEMDSFFNTAFYAVDYMKRYLAEGNGLAYSVFGADLLCLFGTLILIIVGAKKISAVYTSYAFFYFLFVFAPTWLIGGVRYSLCLFVLPFYLAAITHKRTYLTIVLGVVLLSINIFFLILVGKGYQFY